MSIMISEEVCKKKIALLKEINSMRDECELKEIKHGQLLCLQCGRKFYSYDKVNERLCGTCRRKLSE